MLKEEPEKKSNQILFLLDLNQELEGLDLPYSEMIEDLFINDTKLSEFKSRFLEKVHVYIKEIIDKAEVGATILFDLKKMRYSQFSKYSFKIVSLRKEEFESIEVIKVNDIYNLSGILKTYYGKKFSKILNLGLKFTVNPAIFKKFVDFSKKLKLKIDIA
jgi:phosphopentomutase